MERRKRGRKQYIAARPTRSICNETLTLDPFVESQLPLWLVKAGFTHAEC
jgi:hypothetical protein